LTHPDDQDLASMVEFIIFVMECSMVFIYWMLNKRQWGGMWERI